MQYVSKITCQMSFVATLSLASSEHSSARLNGHGMGMQLLPCWASFRAPWQIFEWQLFEFMRDGEAEGHNAKRADAQRDRVATHIMTQQPCAHQGMVRTRARPVRNAVRAAH
eukprot:6181449-Pleurochrysis_carterae.AAC.5